MGDETTLRNACYANLGDDLPWAALEDYYRERGDKMAERMGALRQVLTGMLPVALPIAEFAPPREADTLAPCRRESPH
jgi:hypothetical protein